MPFPAAGGPAARVLAVTTVTLVVIATVLRH